MSFPGGVSSDRTSPINLQPSAAHLLSSPTANDTMLIRDFPNELIIVLGAQLPLHDLYHLTLLNHRFSELLLPQLRELALRPENAKPALYWAVLSGDRSLAQHVLEKAGDTIAVFGRYDPSLDRHLVYRAPMHCDTETMDWIMNQRARLYLETGGEGLRKFTLNGVQGPTLWAVENEHHTLLGLVLDKDERMSHPYEFSNTLLHAARHGKITTMNFLLDWASRSLCGYRECVNMTLCQAVESDMEAIIPILVENGADVDACDSAGRPVLAIAAGYASPGVIMVLLEKGAKVNVEDAEGHSPLEWALGRYEELVKHEILDMLRKKKAEEDRDKEQGLLMARLAEKEIAKEEKKQEEKKKKKKEKRGWLHRILAWLKKVKFR